MPSLLGPCSPSGPGRDLPPCRPRRATPLYSIRRRLLTAHDRLGAGTYERMLERLEVGDPAGEVAAAYLAKELLSEVYATTDLDEAGMRLGAFHDHCRQADIRELTRLSRTVRRWPPQVLAWHTTALTNGPTEAVNLLVKKVKRVGPRLPQLRELPAPTPAPLRRPMADSSSRINASP